MKFLPLFYPHTKHTLRVKNAERYMHCLVYSVSRDNLTFFLDRLAFGAHMK